jgi:hypothetical protein
VTFDLPLNDARAHQVRALARKMASAMLGKPHSICLTALHLLAAHIISQALWTEQETVMNEFLPKFAARCAAMPDDDACTDAEFEAYEALMKRVAAAFSGARSDMALMAVESLAVFILRNVPEDYQAAMFMRLTKSIGERLARGDADDDDTFTMDPLH